MKLETKNVVETREGKRYLVTGDILVGKDSYMHLNRYDEKLKHESASGYALDIIKVYRPNFPYKCIPNNFCDLKDDEIIWKERPMGTLVSLVGDGFKKFMREDWDCEDDINDIYTYYTRYTHYTNEEIQEIINDDKWIGVK